MIGRRQVRARSSLVHHVQQKHALLAVLLEFLQIFALQRRGALDLEELDVVGSERFRDLFREVEELNKDKNAFVGRDALPAVKVSGLLYLIKTP